MIYQSDVTYNRFPRSSDYTRPNANGATEKSDSAEAKPQKILPASHPMYKATRSHMDDLVDRLNSKSYLFQSQVSFEVGTVKNRPHIIMKSPENVLNRFESPDDLMELERSLHDMAGFRFSIVG